VVMESTAQYWRPVWQVLEPSTLKLRLAQARSNRGPRGRKNDYGDALRLARRLLTGELSLSYVPDAEQRVWRRLSRTRQQWTQERAQIQNQIENLLPEGRIQLSGVISDLLGASGRRILRALADGEQDAEKLAALGEATLQATPAQLREALRGELAPALRILLGMHLDRIEFLDRQIQQLEEQLHAALQVHSEAIRRLCEIPGIGVTAATQLVAEIGPKAQAFQSAGQLASWGGLCPGCEESAGVSRSDHSPKGNRVLRRVIALVAWAAVRRKGSIFQRLFRNWVPRLGIRKALWAVAHRVLRVIWIVLHQGVAYIEKGTLALSPQQVLRRTRQLTRQLNRLGYAVQLAPLTTPS